MIHPRLLVFHRVVKISPVMPTVNIKKEGAVMGDDRPFTLGLVGNPTWFLQRAPSRSSHFTAPSLRAYGGVEVHWVPATGQRVSAVGHVVSTVVHAVTVAGHCVSTAGHFVTSAGHSVATSGHFVASAGHTVA